MDNIPSTSTFKKTYSSPADLLESLHSSSSDRISAALYFKALNGFWPSKAPFGYDTARRVLRWAVLQPNDKQASIVRKLFMSYTTGDLRINDLVKMAAEEGLRKANSTKPLGHFEILRILRNPLYCGIVRWKGLVCFGKHKPLVSIQTWEKVQVKIRIEKALAEKEARRS